MDVFESCYKLLMALVIASLFVLGCDGNGENDIALLDLSLPLETATTEEAGVNAAMLAEAEKKAAEIPRVVSMLTLKEGRIVQEAYFHGATASTLHDVRSVTKSIVSTMVGAMLEERLLEGLDETLGDHISEDVAALTSNTSSISIRHLLTMSSGFTWDETTSNSYSTWILSGDHIDHVLGLPFANPPGTSFTYNSGAVHLLGVLLEEATPQSLESLADSLLFQPLGITSLRWENLGEGYVNGGAGIDLRTRDLARLGQLYLQNGITGRQRLLTENWVLEATTPRFNLQVTNGPLQDIDYGYLWWIVQDQPERAYFAWGFGGQYIYVVPDLELVVVTTTAWQGVTQDEGGVVGLEEAVMDIVINDIVAAVRG